MLQFFFLCLCSQFNPINLGVLIEWKWEFFVSQADRFFFFIELSNAICDTICINFLIDARMRCLLECVLCASVSVNVCLITFGLVNFELILRVKFVEEIWCERSFKEAWEFVLGGPQRGLEVSKKEFRHKQAIFNQAN